MGWPGAVRLILRVEGATMWTKVILGLTVFGFAVFAGTPVKIADPCLETAIREALGGYEGPLFPELLNLITELNAVGYGIENLGGIEHLRNIKTLDLSSNKIQDLSPLQELKNLEELSVFDNQVQDLSPKGKLLGLKRLSVSYNKVEDLQPLSALLNLRSLTSWQTPFVIFNLLLSLGIWRS